MKITCKYDRRDFFGNQVYTEDYTYVYSTKTALEALTKCQRNITNKQKFEFTAMISFEGNEIERFKPNDLLKEAGAKDCDTVLIWQECSDRQNDLVTLRTSKAGNWQQTKILKSKMGSVMRCIAAAVDL